MCQTRMRSARDFVLSRSLDGFKRFGLPDSRKGLKIPKKPDRSTPDCEFGWEMDAAEVVASLCAHPGDIQVQQNGCAALGRIAEASPECGQAVVEAGGAAAVVASLRAHRGDIQVQQNDVEQGNRGNGTM